MAYRGGVYTVSPGVPLTGQRKLYPKSDGWYDLDSANIETKLSPPSLPLSIANGGTAATSAGAALVSLGAAARGANSDITSLTGLTTPLSRGQGGTGLVTTTVVSLFTALSPTTTKGDIAVYDATQNDRLPVGTVGQVLTVDPVQALGVKWATPTSGATIEPSTSLVLYDDFFSSGTEAGEIGTLGWTNYNAGTGNNFDRIPGTAAHPGMIQLVPGTVETGRSCISLGDPGGFAPFIVGNGITIVEWCFSVTNAAVATFEEIAFGLGDVFNAVGDQSNGIYFRFLGGLTPDTAWQLVTANGGTRSTSSTSQAYSSGTFFRMRFTSNAAGTSWQASINGTNVGTPITTNIPTGAISPFFKADAVVGGALTQCNVDYFYMQQTFTTPR